jgi:hypothetical protein
MTAIVVEEGLALAVAAPRGERVVIVPRPSRRRGGGPDGLDPDAVVEALERAGPGAIVLARPPAADPGARALPALAAVMGREVVRLPEDAEAAAWVVAVAAVLDRGAGATARRLQVLVGTAAAAPALPRRPVGAGAARMPALRPGVLARWAGCVWRPCARCGGGGLPGAACGRCGAGLAAAGAP